eukprot:TRINITY_DN11308_c0_g1_i1.p1 TRINITY_DN11308_c0_g1~~TRINITY_DN11308_c0_g1_i1.p1  ORF type:complete len:1041 (+),score=164.63 TRINITY_DN11308_c0_g1_i1:66-3188(+)
MSEFDALLALRPQTLQENFTVCADAKELIEATYLDFKWKKIVTLDEAFGRLTNLLELNLSKNEITSLPDAIAGLGNLRCWILDDNKLSEIPWVISRLTNLTYLSAHHNCISVLSDNFDALGNLCSLKLSHNQLSALPQSITHLSRLQELHLSHNKLSYLPFGISRMTALKLMSVQFNQLSGLPYTIGQLTNLREFYIGAEVHGAVHQANNITKLPLSLGNLQNLEILDLENTPIEFPRQQVLDTGVKGTSEFLSHFALEENPLNYVRILFMGDTKSGKTTLLNTLLLTTIRFESHCQPDYVPTNGVEVCREAYYLHHDNERIAAFLWDFGGSHTTRVYYPYLLSRESLVIFTWDSSEDPDTQDLKRWAAMLSMFAPGAAIIVVGTKIDLVKHDQYNMLAKRGEVVKEVFSSFEYALNIVDYLFMSNHSGEQLFKLKHIMTRTVFASDSIRKPYPNYFLQFSRIADGYTRYQPTPVASLEEMELNLRMFRGTMSIHQALEKLHDLGMLVWINQEHLHEYIYCHVPYLMRLFSQVFDVRRSHSDLGFIPTEALLSRYEDSFPGYAELAITILRRFQLSFPHILGQYEVFPSLLTEGTPHPSVWSWNPTHATHSYCTSELEFNHLPDIAFNSMICRIYPILHRDYSALSTLSKEHLSSNMFVFTVSANKKAPHEPTYHASLVRGANHNRFYISVRSSDRKYPSFECMKHLTNMLTKGLSYFKNVSLQSRYILCPQCTLNQPSFDSCGRVPIDGLVVGEDGTITCPKDRCALKLEQWMEGIIGQELFSDSEADHLFVPSVLQMQVDSDLSPDDPVVILHLLCEQPDGVHRTDAPGIRISCTQIMARKDCIHFLLRLWKPRMSLDKESSYDSVSARDLAEWIRQKGNKPFRVPLSPSYAKMLASLDPRAEWKASLQAAAMHDNQYRHLCKHCHFQAQQGWSTYITQTPQLLSGYMLYRHEAFYKSWERRFFVLDQEQKTLLRFYDASKAYQSGVIRLEPLFEIGTHNYGDDLAGFYLHVGKTKYQFKTKTTTERDSWILNISKCR